MLVDDFLPVYDVSDAVATVVNADVATTWDALLDADLIEVGRRRPLVGVLGAIRVLPDVVSQMVFETLRIPGTPGRSTPCRCEGWTSTARCCRA